METLLAPRGEAPRTRARVARLLLERGPQTAAALAAELGVTPAGVRRHLDAMVERGEVVPREQRPRVPRGPGRPARAYAVTDAGRALTGRQEYDEVAASALRFLTETGGEAALAEFASRRAAELEARWSGPGDAGADGAAGEPGRLAAAMTRDGFAATVEPVVTGTTLCQHHCPVQALAAEFPQLCEAETAALSRLLGSHVQRLATLAHGDGVCTTHIPHPLSRTTAATAGGPR